MKLKKEIRTITTRDGQVVEVEVTHGSGNVFADLGLTKAEEKQQKCSLRAQIEESAAQIGLDLPDLPEIAGRHWNDISLDEYRACLERLSARAQSSQLAA